MDLKLYNYLTKKKEIFKPLKKGFVDLYTCGPTVYDSAHLGNLRTYIFEDVLRRTLKANGFKVKQVMNITDVEDKIIKKMRLEKKTLQQITEPYTKLFFEDLKKLNIEKTEVYPKATEHIKEIIKLIAVLLKKEFAYQAEDGSIYFKISKFKNYGKLSGLSELRPPTSEVGAPTISADEYEKEEARDFVLWKKAKPSEPFWDSPFGPGRPGWHIECSAMSMKYLGESFDIHAGAIDLLFPHHENEIAQSEAATGKKIVNFWLEGEHLLVNNQKMAKSLKNFLTLKNLEKNGFDPLAFRYLVLTSHYRKKLNFTWESLEAGQNALRNLRQFVGAPTSDVGGRSSDKLTSIFDEKRFLTALNNDLNAPKALAILWQVLKDKNLSTGNKQKLIFKFDEVLGLGLNKIRPKKAPASILKLIKEREKLRREKKWQEADGIRQKIQQKGWKIEDTEKGTKIKHG